MGTIIDIFSITMQRHEPLWHCTHRHRRLGRCPFYRSKISLFLTKMTAQKRFINFRYDGSHVTSRARRCDVTEIKKLFLSNNNHIVLTNFGVRYDSRLVIDVLYKMFTKLLTDPRILPVESHMSVSFDCPTSDNCT